MSKKQYNEEDFSGISDMLEGKHHVSESNRTGQVR